MERAKPIDVLLKKFQPAVLKKIMDTIRSELKNYVSEMTHNDDNIFDALWYFNGYYHVLTAVFCSPELNSDELLEEVKGITGIERTMTLILKNKIAPPSSEIYYLLEKAIQAEYEPKVVMCMYIY